MPENQDRPDWDDCQSFLDYYEAAFYQDELDDTLEAICNGNDLQNVTIRLRAYQIVTGKITIDDETWAFEIEYGGKHGIIVRKWRRMRTPQ